MANCVIIALPMPKTLLATFFYPPEKGGLQNHLENLFKRLPSKQVVVLTKKQPGDFDFDRKQAYKIYRTSFDSPLKYLKLSTLSFSREIKKIVQKENIKKLVIGHSLPLGLSAMRLKNSLGLHYDVFVHGKEVFEITTKNRALQTYALESTLKNADHIICTTDIIKQKIAGIFDLDKDKIEIIPPGVDLDKFSPTTKPSKDNLSLLTVARLVRRKGHHLVIEALGPLIRKYPDLSYNIVGDGEEKNNLKNQVKDLKLEKNVIFHGQLSDKEVIKQFATADIFVMPSLDLSGDLEGFGLVFLEAAAAALPVVSTKTGGIPEAVVDSKTGILIDINKNNKTVQELEKALFSLLDNPQKRQQMGQNGLLRAKQSFTWAEQVAKLKSLLS